MELDSHDTLKPHSLPHFFNHPAILCFTPGADAPHQSRLPLLLWIWRRRRCPWTPPTPPPEPLHHLFLRCFYILSTITAHEIDSFYLCVCERRHRLLPPPPPRRTVSVASVSCARSSFHASFVASQPRLINKTPLLFFSLLSSGTSAPGRVSPARQAVIAASLRD